MYLVQWDVLPDQYKNCPYTTTSGLLKWCSNFSLSLISLCMCICVQSAVQPICTCRRSQPTLACEHLPMCSDTLPCLLDVLPTCTYIQYILNWDEYYGRSHSLPLPCCNARLRLPHQKTPCSHIKGDCRTVARDESWLADSHTTETTYLASE